MSPPFQAKIRVYPASGSLRSPTAGNTRLTYNLQNRVYTTILSNDSSLKIIMLSGSVSRKFVSESIKAGASGYISKTSMFEELCEAVKVVKEGLSYISPSITTILINDYIENASDVKQEDINALTGRERGILQMLAEGKNAKQIAEVFGVSSKTVDAERRVIMEKLDRYSIAELTKYAISQGLTSVDF